MQKERQYRRCESKLGEDWEKVKKVEGKEKINNR